MYIKFRAIAEDEGKLRRALCILWSGVMDWSLGLESWSGVLEWILGVEPWSDILSVTEKSILVVKFVSGRRYANTKCVTNA